MYIRLFAFIFAFFSFISYSQEIEKDFYQAPGDISKHPYTHPSLSLIPLHKVDFKPKVGGIDFLPNGNLLVCTWDSLGDVFELSNVLKGDSTNIKIRKIASGLCEPLGIKTVGNRIFVLQRPELTELIDNDKDGTIDEYRTVCDKFGFSGNYHEFAFGLLYKDGWFYGTLSTPRRTRRPSPPDRGTAFRIDTLGKIEYLASGFRTPNGIGFGANNEIFINDNQGEYVPTSKMIRLQKGGFYGYRDVDFRATIGLSTIKPVIWMPHYEIGNSPSEPVYLPFGMYKGQFLHGDVTHGGLKRVFLEKVDTVYQGCIFNFTQGLEGGINRIKIGPDSALYVGAIGSAGNWSQEGKHWYGLQKLKFNGKTAFEILNIKILSNGFELNFTEPISSKVITKPSTFDINTWTYKITEEYGGPKIDEHKLAISSVNFSADRKKITLEIPSIKEGYVVHFQINDKQFISSSNQKLWTSQAWYTVNKIPKGKKSIIQTQSVAKVPTSPVQLNTKQIQGLMQQKGCYQCHDIKTNVIGPSFVAVSQKYKSQPSGKQYLIQKVAKGGTGVWGGEAMPAQTHLKKSEIEAIVNYILEITQ